jgi:hypothetical protein
MGSMISAGEAKAFVGAILGHANPRSTAIYAHVRHDPAKQFADRISERIAAAHADAEAVGSDADPESVANDEQLLTGLAKVLAKESPDAERLRALLKM